MTDSKDRWVSLYDYDESMHSMEIWSNYTKTIINKGHQLINKICNKKYIEHNNSTLKILDIGCGDTDLYMHFDEIVSEYIGIEPIKREILKAQKDSKKYLIRGTAEKLPLNDNCVDIALHISTLDHCYDAKKAMNEFIRVLKIGGIGIILLENRERLSNTIRKIIRMEVSHGEEHFYYFNIGDIEELIPENAIIKYKNSYGFLLGFNWISKFIPIKIIQILSSIADNLIGRIYSNRGQHFLIVIEKVSSSNPDNKIKVLCPQCGSLCEKKPNSCGNCNYQFSWINNDVLDYIPEIP